MRRKKQEGEEAMTQAELESIAKKMTDTEQNSN